ncbi:hypothetical protein [Alkaliphilus sp. B6464]|nr:hypothetical protein [Alkaliphilus sp. B6464]
MTRPTTNGDYNAYAVHLLICSLKNEDPMTLEDFKALLDNK